MRGAWAAKLVVFIAAVEATFWLFGTISIHRGNPWRLFDPVLLAAGVEANLPVERHAPAAGWPVPEATIERAHPATAMRRCGSAWGGSFTVSDDVADAEAWPYLGSVRLGCEIANVGVDGFGFDQTLILLEQRMPRDSLVILGMSQPMITVGGASSWSFLDLKNRQPQASTTKPFFRLIDGGLRLEPRPTPEVSAIIAHYRSDDFGSRWTPFRFPFTVSVSLALYRKFSELDPLQLSAMDPAPEIRRQRDLANATIAAMAAAALRNGNRFAVLLIPRPEDAASPSPHFAAMFHALGQMVPPDVCLIDPSAELQSAVASLEHPLDIMTKSSHYAPAGNAALAAALVRGLADCRIEP